MSFGSLPKRCVGRYVLVYLRASAREDATHPVWEREQERERLDRRGKIDQSTARPRGRRMVRSG